jgi:hypothetical protein
MFEKQQQNAQCFDASLSRKNAFKYRLENYFTSWIFLSTFRQ